MYTLGIALAAANLVLVSPYVGDDEPLPAAVQADQVPPSLAKPKVLCVDSYHEGYPWSEGILGGIFNVMKINRRADGGFDDSASPVTLRVCRMDTKRNPSEQFKVQAGLQVKQVIEQWRPDIVICADDNSSQYVIVPHYRDASLPFVFCGVNWDASAYGFPCSNVTGMIEVSLVHNLLDVLRAHARGTRVGLLAADNESNRKEAANYTSKLGVKLDRIVFVETFEQWKNSYLKLQQQVDMLILAPPSFLATGAESEADQSAARKFVLENTSIPTGSVEDWIAPYSLVCVAKLSSEQGEWAANAALRILTGTSPEDIPVESNHNARIVLNMPLAKRLGLVFPVELIEQAALVTEVDQ